MTEDGASMNDIRQKVENFDPTKRKDVEETISDEDLGNFIESFGECKWFDVEKGYGFITPDQKGEEQKDVFVYQSTIQMPGFRSLKKGEKVRFWYKTSTLGLEAVKVCGPTGENCMGSPKKPPSRKKKPERCFNCGEVGHHAKECSFPPLPKRCHHCKSVEHLVVDCPAKHDPQGDANELDDLSASSSVQASASPTAAARD